jgi:hypothetical protein
MPFTKLTTALHLPRPSGGNLRYTDTNAFLSPGVLIAYHARPAPAIYPPLAEKAAINAAAIQARNIVRIANDEMAKVVILRRPESALFTSIMERHFNLSSTGGLGGGLLTDNTINKPFRLGDVFKHDRRWVLEQIRQGILSLSFHLNTGIYLIDMDIANRTADGGTAIAAGTIDPDEAYTYRYGAGGIHLCGFRNGEIHLDFTKMPIYSLNAGASLIIHEAGHKFLNVGDTFYAYDVNYPPALNLCLDANADSFAWTAVSLATGALRMPTHASTDWTQCPGAAL